MTCTKCNAGPSQQRGTRPNGYIWRWCRACIDAHEHSRKLKLRYGITAAEYAEQLARQAGVCALCDRPPGRKRLHVDHDHETGAVRGLLCLLCNIGLGFLERRGAQATEYLARAVWPIQRRKTAP
jgi:hypothetical protein